MRGSTTYLAGRLSRRARLTALGITLCVGFSVLSFTIVEGLRSSTYQVSEQFYATKNLVSRPDLSPFDPLAFGIREGTFVLLSSVVLEDGREVTFAAFEAPDLRPPPLGVVRPGPALTLPNASVMLTSPIETRLSVGAPLKLNQSQPHWGVVAPETMRALDSSLSGHRVSYVLAGTVDAVERDRLVSQGFVVRPVPAVVPFFESGVSEVIRDLILIVVFSGVLVSVLAFEFMQLEVREKRRQIGIWRALGMKRPEVLRLLLQQAALLAGIGIVAGSLIAMLIVYVAKRVTGLAVLDPTPSALLLAMIAVVILAAVVGGALLPAMRASHGTVRDALEAAQ